MVDTHEGSLEKGTSVGSEKSGPIQGICTCDSKSPPSLKMGIRGRVQDWERKIKNV
jgi:hypothetical protein